MQLNSLSPLINKSYIIFTLFLQTLKYSHPTQPVQTWPSSATHRILSAPFICGFPTPPPAAGPGLPGGRVCPLPSPHGVSPSAQRPFSLPPASGRDSGPGAALTELGDVPGHRVVLLAPVQRGGGGAPVALAVRRRSHHARRRRRRRPGALLAALGSAGSQAGSGPARALASRPALPPRRAGPGAVTNKAWRGGPAHRRRSAALASPGQGPPRGRGGCPTPSFPRKGRDPVRPAAATWAVPALPRHACGCGFGVPDILEAVFCQEVSELPSVCVGMGVE